MVYENNLPKIETIYEIKEQYKIPSLEEFLKNYEYDSNLNYDDLSSGDISEARGYGPCRNTLCGCSCPKTKCDCKNPEISFDKDRNQKFFTANLSGGDSWGGAARSMDGEFAIFQETRHDGDLKIGTVSAGIEKVEGIGSAVRAGVNLVHFKGQGVEAKAGFNLDTGGSISANGVEIKAGGIGFSIGKQTGLSTPFGEVKVDTEDCVIQ